MFSGGPTKRGPSDELLLLLPQNVASVNSLNGDTAEQFRPIPDLIYLDDFLNEIQLNSGFICRIRTRARKGSRKWHVWERFWAPDEEDMFLYSSSGAAVAAEVNTRFHFVNKCANEGWSVKVGQSSSSSSE